MGGFLKAWVLAPKGFGDFCHKSINFLKKRYRNYEINSNFLAKIEVKHSQFDIDHVSG